MVVVVVVVAGVVVAGLVVAGLVELVVEDELVVAASASGVGSLVGAGVALVVVEASGTGDPASALGTAATGAPGIGTAVSRSPTPLLQAANTSAEAVSAMPVRRDFTR